MRAFAGLLCDLLWSDPDKDVTGWGENDRGVSFTFGPDVVAKFLNRHDLDLICRAHQVPVPALCQFQFGQPTRNWLCCRLSKTVTSFSPSGSW